MPEGITPVLGMRLLGRAANTGTVYLGFDSTVTTSTGTLVPKGDPGYAGPKTIPAEHFNAPGGGDIYLVASAPGQIVDWEIQ